MVYFSCVSTKRSSAWSSPIRWKPPTQFRVVVAVAAFALTGCNANQEVNPSSATAPGVVAGPDFPGYNAYDPTKYAQTRASTPAVAVAVERARLRWPAKSIQASADKRLLALVKPNKSKENRLDFLGFLWPNQDFSMGYSESK
jgi:hypothetical protein